MPRKIPKPGEFYRHFKNRVYQIVAVAEHSETGEALVVYQALYGDFRIYARPLEMFLSEVDRDKYPTVSQEYRFEQVKPGEEETGKKADALEARENAVLPGDGSTEEKEDALWESLADEVAEALGSQEETEPVSQKFLDFLEARSFESKAAILESMKEELDDEMIDGLALAVDVKIPEGELEARYHQLEQCLRTMAKYEDTRLR